jgi:hypothetical protein
MRMGTEIWRDVTVFRWRADRSLSSILGSGLVGQYCEGLTDVIARVGCRTWTGEACFRLYYDLFFKYEQYGCICTSVQM